MAENPFLSESKSSKNPFLSTNIDGSENVLKRAIDNQGRTTQKFNPLKSFIDASIGGPTGYGASPEVEESFPTIGQAVGSGVGQVAGARFFGRPLAGAPIGGVVGRRGGEMAKQGVKALFRGEGFDQLEVEKSTQDAAVMETLFLPVGKFFQALPSAAFGKALRSIPGNPLGKIKDAIINSGKVIPKDEILSPLKELSEELLSQKSVDRTLRSEFLKQIKELESLSSQKAGMLEPIDLANARKSMDLILNKAGIFGKKIPKDFAEANFVVRARELVESKFEQIAKEVGPEVLGQYKEAKGAFAKLAKTFQPGKKSFGGILPDIVRASAITGGMQGDIGRLFSGVLSSEALEARSMEPIVASIFQALQTVGPTGLTEAGKKMGIRDIIRPTNRS